MEALLGLVSHFYVLVRHAAGLRWFRGGAAAREGGRMAALAGGRLFADLSHELQTPLTILRADLEILSGKRKGDRAAALRTMGAATERMSRMVEGFLAAVRMESLGEELELREFLLAELLEEVGDDCALVAEDEGVELSFSCGSAALIVADRDRMKEVVLNLVGNALKHTGRGGGIAVSGRIVADGRARSAEIAVSDTGTGIAPEELPRIFERFYRIGGDASRGTGLGLHICRKIVEAHGGRIAASSELGKGSCFTVFLPLSDAPSDGGERGAPSASLRRRSGGSAL